MTTTMMRDWRTDDMRDWRINAGDNFGRDERCHVSFSSNSIIFSLCFYYASLCFYYASLCFYYAFIMLSLCFYYAFLGTRIIKVSFFGDVTYLRTIFQIRGFLCLPGQDRRPLCVRQIFTSYLPLSRRKTHHLFLSFCLLAQRVGPEPTFGHPVCVHR